MKKYVLTLVILFSITFFLTGCYKDKGNYNYHAVNAIAIKTTAASDSFTVAAGDTLRINVNVTQTIPVDSGLSYKWIITSPFNSVQPSPTQNILGTQQNLAAQILEIPNNYLVTAQVTDQKSGVTFFHTFYVTVTPDKLSMNEGWLVLEQASGGSDVSYLSYPATGTIMHNIYSLNNAGYLPSDAFSLTVVNTIRQNPNQYVMILSGSDMVQADYLKLSKVAGYNNLFFTPPSTRRPQAFSSRLQTNMNLLLDNNSLFLSNNTAPAQAIDPFVGPYTGGVGNNNLKYNTNIISNSGSPIPASGYDYYILYDDLSQRFIYFYGGSLTLLGPVNFGAAAAGAPFDMNNIGKQYLHVDNTVDGYRNEFASTFFCLFKNNNNDSLFLYQVLNKTGSNSLPATQVNAIAIYPVLNAPGLATAKNFTSSDYTYQVYYESGNNIYVLNAQSGQAHIIYSFPAGVQINVVKLFKPQYVKFPAYAPADCSVLAVATQEAGQGKLYTFNLSPSGDITGNTYTNVWGGFGNIKDFAFKKVAGQ